MEFWHRNIDRLKVFEILNLNTNLLNYVCSKFAIIKQDPVIFSKITAEAYKIERNEDEPKIMIL